MKKRIGIIVSVFIVAFVISLGSEKNGCCAATKEQTKDVMALTGITVDKKGKMIGTKKKVTRAEFAKMLAQASPYSGEIAKTEKRIFFKDVNKGDKNASYINFAATKGYMSGYLGGKFKPNQGITLREAIYSVLTLLGYSKEDFSGNLAEARYEKYKELGLGKNIVKREASVLNQTDCMYLFYNLLNAKKKSGEIYATTIGYSVTKSNKIDYQSLLAKKRKGAIIVKDSWQKKLPMSLQQFEVYKNGKKALASDIKNYNIVYYVKELKKLWVYDQQVFGTVSEIAANTDGIESITVNGKRYATEHSKRISTLLEKNRIEAGDEIVLLLGREKKIASVLSVKTMIAEEGWEKKLPISLKNFELYLNDKKVDNQSIEPYSVVYYIKELKKMWIYDKKVYGVLDAFTIQNTQLNELSVDGTVYTAEHPKIMKKNFKETKVKKGDFIVLLLGRDDFAYKVLPINSVTAIGNWRNQIPFQVESSIINKNGKKITANQIENYDILYYSKELKMIWDYSKRVYGVVNEIKPDRTAPEEITVAGKTYSLKGNPVYGENLQKEYSLGENKWGGQFAEKNIQVGSDVVLLFGPKDAVAAIYPVEKMGVTIVGYVLQRETKMIKEVNGTFGLKDSIKLVDTSGVVREFVCMDKTIQKGSIVEVSFDTTVPTIKKLIHPGNINFTSENIKIADDARIIDVNDKNYTSVSKKELEELKWNVGNILYYRTNNLGEITDMVLANVTGTVYQYGILKEIKDGNEGEYSEVSFICNIGGTDGEYEVDEKVNWGQGIGPKAFRIENNKIKEMKDMVSVPVRFIDGKQANTGKNVYRISDKALVYYLTNGTYYSGKLEDITEVNGNTIYGYVEQQGGAIRVLVVMK